MRLIFGVAAAFAAVTMGQPAAAQTVTSFYTGKDLLDQCRVDRKWCGGFIMGVVDGVTGYVSYTRSMRIFCLPRSLTSVEITDQVTTYLESKTELQYDASSYVMLVLVEAYPCPKS